MKNALANFPSGNNTELFENPDLSTSSRNLVLHHLGSFKANDLDKVMSDYTDSSVLIAQKEIYKGISEIRSFFVGLITHFPLGKSGFTLDQIDVKDELVFIIWQGKTPTLHVPFGTDTFVIEHGKIRFQTFVGELNFIK